MPSNCHFKIHIPQDFQDQIKQISSLLHKLSENVPLKKWPNLLLVPSGSKRMKHGSNKMITRFIVLSQFNSRSWTMASKLNLPPGSNLASRSSKFCSTLKSVLTIKPSCKHWANKRRSGLPNMHPDFFFTMGRISRKYPSLKGSPSSCPGSPCLL